MMKATVRDLEFCVLLMTITIVVTYLSMSAVGINAAEWKSTITVNDTAKVPRSGGSRGDARAAFELNQEQGGRTKWASKNAIAIPNSQEQPTECDAATGRLDNAVIDTGKLEGAYLIILARLGTGEKSRRLNQHRLGVVEEYILRRGSDLKYVLAEGRRVKGLGRVEVYVGGRLVHVMPLKKNAPGWCLPGREGF